MRPVPTRRAWTLMGRVALSCVLFVVCNLASIISVGSFADATESPGRITTMAAIAMLVGIIGSVSVFWHRSHPAVVLVVGLATGLIGGGGWLLAAVGLCFWIASSTQPWHHLISAAGVLGLVGLTVRDLFRPHASTMWPAISAGEFDQVLVGVSILTLGIAVGCGLYLRLLRARHRDELRVEAEQRRNADLTDEVTRQQEREDLAREVHDSLAHRLTLISMQSGSLEDAVASTNPDAVSAARALRRSAGESLDDLRSLLTSLREGHTPPGNTPPPTPSPGLAGLPDLIDEAELSGLEVHPNVVISDADQAPAQLNRAVYRIAQEALTNALRHSEDSRVTFKLRGRPGQGVHLEAVNRVAAPALRSPGANRGLTGITERVHLLGGTVDHGVDGDWFRLRVFLPWPEGAPDAPVA